MKDAKAWFPISALLVSVIYTGSKSLVSRYTPFENGETKGLSRLVWLEFLRKQ